MQPLNFSRFEEIYHSVQWYVILIINECAMIYGLACDKLFCQKITNPIALYTQAFTQEYTAFYGGIWSSNDPFGLNVWVITFLFSMEIIILSITLHPDHSPQHKWYGSGHETVAVLLPGFAIIW